MLLLIIALATLAGAAYFAFDAVTYSAQERRAVVRRAADYGRFKQTTAVERERFTERALAPMLENLAQVVLRANPKASVEAVDARLLASGLAQRITATTFLAIKGAGTIVGGLVGLMVGNILFIPILAVLGYKAPDFAVGQVAKRRRRQLNIDLPDALDLLAVSVEAGHGFDGAIMKLIEHMEGPLAEEFALTLGEMRVGQTRSDALKNLATRTDLPEMSSFTRAIIQADQLGISLGRILRIQAADSRHKRQSAAEEKAMKAPIKMLFPTAIFIFPVIFVVVLAPAFLNIGDVF
jgi:tight adherence protein C